MNLSMTTFFVVLISKISEANFTLPLTNLENFSLMTNCINQIITNLPKTKYIYTINFDWYLKKPTVRLDFTKNNQIWHKNERSDLFIINLEKTTIQIIPEIVDLIIFNPRGTTILITEKINSTIFSVASKFFLSKLLVVELSTLQIYTYQPFKKGSVNRPQNKYVSIGNCNNSITPVFEKLPKKWFKTTIRALNNIIPPYVICPTCPTNRGIEIEAFDIITHYLGLKVVYTRTDFDYWGRKSNGMYTYIFGELQRREGEMAIGVFHSKFDEHLDFDMSYSYMEDSTRWLVPKAKILPYWKRLGLIFAKEVYLSLFFSIICMVVICAFLYEISYASSWIMLYQVLLELSLKELPFNFRIIMMLWIGSCLILSTMFKSKMIDIMSKNSYEHQISNLKDITDSKLDIVIDHDIATFYQNFTNSEEEYIQKNYKYCINPRFCINRTAYTQDCVTVDFQRSNDFFLPEFVDSDGDVLLYLFKTPIFLVHIHLFFVKGYPVFPQINKMLLWMKANGIIKHLYDNASHNAKLAISKKTIFKAEVLGLAQLQVSFFIWGFGMLVALIIFIGEYLIGVGIERRKKHYFFEN